MTDSLRIVEADVLVIGSGIAGLEAALTVAKAGRKPLLVSKSPIGKANNTILAGGAFACATPEFSVRQHIEKTLESGGYLNHRELVAKFAQRAPAKIEWLKQSGLSGSAHAAGFHCRSFALVGGPALCAILVTACRNAGVRWLENMVVTDLLTDDGVCRGALAIHKPTGKMFGLQGRAVVLASGGAGSIFLKNDNAPGSTGDGYLLGLEAGLELVDMEFVQFYPLAYAGSGRGRMILPAAFGDIGKIINRQGEDIKEKYGLFEKPVAIVSRDRLSQALFAELAGGNGVDGALLLDLRGADESALMFGDDLKARFRKRLAYDTRPLKIIPACHHTMGGVVIDGQGKTAREGLFAAGEVVGGIHGANRMGGNALSEGLVFGELAAASACGFVDTASPCKGFERIAQGAAEKRFGILGKGRCGAPGLMKRLQAILWECAGIVRSEQSLKDGIGRIDALLSELSRQGAANPADLCRIFECRSAAVTGKAVAMAALERTESRGAHFREDFPSPDAGWLKHICIRMVDGELVVSRIDQLHRPVENLTSMG